MKNKGVSRRGILFALVGPAASGKSTISARLHQEFGATTHFSVSLTSRPARPNEEDGQNYFFVDRETFEKKIAAGELFEWEEVHGHLYGTLKSTVDQSIASGIDLLLDIDIKGALNFKDSFPADAIVVFVVPPSFEVLRKRLINRGIIGNEEFTRRMATARREYELLFETIEAGVGVDYFVINDDLESAYSNVKAILLAERLRITRLRQDGIRAICVVN